MSMKVLVSDLDGTFYPKKGEDYDVILALNIEAAKRWLKAGNTFVIASARGLNHYQKISGLIGTDINYIGCNGAEIRFENGKELFSYIDPKILKAIITFFDKNDINANVAFGTGDKWIFSKRDRYPLDHDDKLLELIDGFIEEMEIADVKTTKVQIFLPQEIRDEVLKMIIDLNLDIDITASDSDLIEIGPKGISKASGLIELVTYYGIPAKEFIVVGDSLNDITMFKMSKHSYCLIDGEEAAKREASKIIKNFKEVIDSELALL